MNDALHNDPGTAAVVDAVNRSHRSHAWIARRIGMSESTIHRQLTCKSPMTVAEADRIRRTLGTSFLAETSWSGAPEQRHRTSSGSEPTSHAPLNVGGRPLPNPTALLLNGQLHHHARHMPEARSTNASTIITDGIHFPHGGDWEAISNDRKDTRWSAELMGIILALVGDNEIAYSTGAVFPSLNSDSAKIEITILTPASVILADFTAGSSTNDRTSWRLLRHDVRAHPRSAISSIHVEPAPIAQSTGRSEPGQVAVTVVVAGASRRLPASVEADYDPRLTALLTNLNRSW
ncbi:hypothetical protein GSU69_02805 [Rathayibacter festucae]|uniref:XRE family transcriptional regulator n=1 Tax=Rathayibacter festucae TaxID=110937 RepID=A0ABX6GWC2_9MICO|nr:hypothetical protein [Rathayibacter festucae]QHC61730.1 hypothetical protein GSU69_02805 [Rathayibacter festucae]